MFGNEHRNINIFDSMIKGLIDEAFEGENSSFFCYGQTGSGKTHTITGSETEEGVVQLSMRYIDRLIAESNSHSIEISSFEVYKEQIYDLLVSESYKEPLRITEKSPNGNFEIDKLSKHRAKNLHQMVQILQQADNQRHFAETYLDHLSSRSHMGFRIYLLNKASSTLGSITFIDLAGSEKIRAYADGGNKQDIGHDFSPIRATK